MIFSTSSSNKTVRVWRRLLLAGLALVGAMLALAVESVAEETGQLPGTYLATADTASPQVVKSVTVEWRANSYSVHRGDVLTFELEKDGGAIEAVQSSTRRSWRWQPQESGSYRLRIVAERAGRSRPGPWSEPFEIVAPLEITSLSPSLKGPQAALTVPIDWQAEVIGGVGERQYRFELRKDKESPATVAEGSVASWRWAPDAEGLYSLRVSVTDSLGNSVEGDWSKPYRIVPPLRVELPTIDRPAPQMAGSGPFRWDVVASGGVGERTYRFELRRNNDAAETVQSGPESRWSWIPPQAGLYQVRVVVADSLDNETVSEWTEEYRVLPTLAFEKVAVDKPSPQMVGTGPFTWHVSVSGGVGELAYQFELQKNGWSTTEIPTGAEPFWSWPADQPGEYMLRVVVTDSLENRHDSGWFGPYVITPPLIAEPPRPSEPSPQAAKTRSVDWLAAASGGVAPLAFVYELESGDGVLPSDARETEQPWTWRPEQQGLFRTRAIVTDLRGNRVTSDWSEPFEIVPELRIATPVATVPGPQVADTVAIPWTVAASGGVGDKRFVFELEQAGVEDSKTYRRSRPDWRWQPDAPGDYRLRATMIDARDNRVVSDWTVPYRVEPPLAIGALAADRAAPQAALTVPINWTAAISGGVAPITCAFELEQDGGLPRFVQQGYEKQWQWRPESGGDYRVRIVATDLRGNREVGRWERFRVAPPLTIDVPQIEDGEDQVLVGNRARWQIRASGGVGKKSYKLRLEDETGAAQIYELGTVADWTWKPETAGRVRLQVTATDSLGNSIVSPWSAWTEARTLLAVSGLTVSATSPQPALHEPIRWAAKTSGGIGIIEYEFRAESDGVETIRKQSTDPYWDWLPAQAGDYRLKVVARDNTGRVVDSGWTEPFTVSPALTGQPLVAFLPLENLSGVEAPLAAIGDRYAGMLENYGLRLLDEERLDAFMHRHRMRYTGGIGRKIARALNEEEGVDAVVITSLESYFDGPAPVIALTSRLVLCQETPRIAWIDGVGLTGLDTPGLLGLGKVTDISRLEEMALTALLESLDDSLSGGRDWLKSGNGGPEPVDHFRATGFTAANPYRVAVVPFLNKHARKNAGFVVPLHLVRELNRYENLEIVEPGLVREVLLQYRLIMQAGPSLATADVLASENGIGADLILSGYVFDYQDQEGVPKIDFATRIFHGPERKVVWWSRSYATGDDGVLFFDFGRERSTHQLMTQMAQAIGGLLLK